jgi:hypothetical protein
MGALQRICSTSANKCLVGGRISLICDLHALHLTTDIEQFAARLDIELRYIQPGAIDQLQPLDRMVFGALKSASRRLFRRSGSANPELKHRQRDAVRDMIEAWERLSEATLTEAWDRYEDDDVWGEGN